VKSGPPLLGLVSFGKGLEPVSAAATRHGSSAAATEGPLAAAIGTVNVSATSIAAASVEPAADVAASDAYRDASTVRWVVAVIVITNGRGIVIVFVMRNISVSAVSAHDDGRPGIYVEGEAAIGTAYVVTASGMPALAEHSAAAHASRGAAPTSRKSAATTRVRVGAYALPLGRSRYSHRKDKSGDSE